MNILDEHCEPILTLLVQEWLRIDDFRNLDTAICNRQCRSSLLSFVRHQEIVFEGVRHETASRKYLQWLVLRSVQVVMLHTNGHCMFDKSLLISLTKVAFVKFISEKYDSQCNLIAFLQNLKYFLNMKTLNVPSAKEFHDIELIGSIVQCPSITALDLNKLKSPRETTVPRLLNHCLELLSLTITECDDLRIPSLLQHSSEIAPFRLTQVNFSGNRDMTNESLENIFVVCPSLRHVNLSFVRLVSTAVDILAVFCPDLRYLNLHYCYMVTTDSMNSVAALHESDSEPVVIMDKDGRLFVPLPIKGG